MASVCRPAPPAQATGPRDFISAVAVTNGSRARRRWVRGCRPTPRAERGGMPARQIPEARFTQRLDPSPAAEHEGIPPSGARRSGRRGVAPARLDVGCAHRPATRADGHELASRVARSGTTAAPDHRAGWRRPPAELAARVNRSGSPTGADDMRDTHRRRQRRRHRARRARHRTPASSPETRRAASHRAVAPEGASPGRVGDQALTWGRSGQPARAPMRSGKRPIRRRRRRPASGRRHRSRSPPRRPRSTIAGRINRTARPVRHYRHAGDFATRCAAVSPSTSAVARRPRRPRNRRLYAGTPGLSAPAGRAARRSAAAPRPPPPCGRQVEQRQVLHRRRPAAG
jgi:hypothetical protein